ncbi:MAG TPA: hypothetical protein VNZ86_13950, partial [Bacteroidia bacterium]|nr:hypothetical protein [Bacteroidia bacterium]
AMPVIQEAVKRRVSTEELLVKRKAFTDPEKELIFDTITITGVNNNQAYFIRKHIQPHNKPMTLEKLKLGYFRLAQDDKIKSLYPFAQYNSKTGYYNMSLKVKKEKYLTAEFGGNFSNRPINEGYIGLQYSYLDKIGVNVEGNGYYGKLYSSAQAKARIDIPFSIPVYLEPNLTFNRFDFFKSSAAFFEDNKPPYLITNDQFAEINLGIPVRNTGKIVIGTGIAQVTDEYYQTTVFSQRDTSDKTYFDYFTTHVSYERNTLNKKQYANSGSYFILCGRFNQGEETFEKGSTGAPISQVPYLDKVHEYVSFKGVYDKYFKLGKHLSLGVYGEAVYSTQSNFNNYTATILSAPVFQPTPESKTLFMEEYRAHEYYAAGGKAVISTIKNLDFRLEGYLFLPYQALKVGVNGQAVYGKPFDTKHYIAEAALVYHTPLGPLCASINYFDTPVQN